MDSRRMQIIVSYCFLSACKPSGQQRASHSTEGKAAKSQVGGQVDGQDKENNVNVLDAVDPQSAKEQILALDGDWQANCEPPLAADNTFGGIRKAYYFEDDIFQSTTEISADADCDTIIGEVKVFGAIALDDTQSAVAITFTIDSVEIEPSSDTAVLLLNQMQICGANDWDLTIRDVTGVDCNFADAFSVFLSAGEKRYNIVGENEEGLKFGASPLLGSKDGEPKPTVLSDVPWKKR